MRDERQYIVRRPKMEFAKKIFTGVSIGTSLIVLFVLAISWATQTTDALVTLIPCAFAELGVATGFYYDKAKAENKIKIEKSFESEEQ